MIEKEFRYITLANGEKKRTVVFPDERYALLSTFFFVEVSAFAPFITENITAVLNGNAAERNISGNVCELHIQKENTTVCDMLAEDVPGSRCTVPTRELLALIEEWCGQE